MLKQILSISTLLIPATSVVNVSQTTNQLVKKLPEKFDQRENYIITSVKDQGSDGICWAYSVISVAEANILKNQLYINKDTLDLSEKNIAYKTLNRNKGEDKLNNTTFDTYHTTDWVASGAYGYQAAYSLLQWNKLRNENPKDWKIPENNTNFKLKDYIYIDNKVNEIEDVKNAVINHGAVSFSFYAVRENKVYYNTEDVDANITKYAHAGAIIGWDDSIPANYFGNKTTKNGAWIVKNSWGNNVFDNGYFYLSYESNIWDLLTLEFTNASNYNNNYYYDAINEDVIGHNQTKAAVVFQSKKSSYNNLEKIKAINLGFDGEDVDVNIKIYKIKNSKNINPRSLELQNPVWEENKHFLHSGLRTIDLSKEIDLEANEWFAVVAEVSNQKNDAKIKFANEENYGNDFSYIENNNLWINSQKSLNGAVARIKVFTSDNFINNNLEVKDLKYASLSLDENFYRYGDKVKIKPKVVLNNKILQENVDYTLTYNEVLDQDSGFYRDDANVGYNKINITGIGDYTGENSIFLTTKVGLVPEIKNSIKQDNKTILYVDQLKNSTNDIKLDSNWAFDKNYSLTNNETEVNVNYVGSDEKYYRKHSSNLTIIKTDKPNNHLQSKDSDENNHQPNTTNDDNLNKSQPNETQKDLDKTKTNNETENHKNDTKNNSSTINSNETQNQHENLNSQNSKKDISSDFNTKNTQKNNQNTQNINKQEEDKKISNPNVLNKTDTQNSTKKIEKSNNENQQNPSKINPKLNTNNNQNSEEKSKKSEQLNNNNKDNLTNNKNENHSFNKNYLWFILIPVIGLISLITIFAIKKKK
ncbi:C1 family peptidase [Mycoplasma miroungirhinis]|uniref:Peptidase C1A papain C-terminal domain-containing protein n=1 Tax=Mycoplasma miroungirhinis TaxID=754516 RepID=A0A6M4JDM8_9MOLU|nr:C1 family peptidase [Mycoplasma miroungirhinis]QJR44177.1 hypothetical protein HLA92_01890 [Mycoplasma miroungirhinis]